MVGLRDRAILATLAYTACRAGSVAKLRLGDFRSDGKQYVLRFQEKGGKSRETPVRHDLQGLSWPMSRRQASPAMPKIAVVSDGQRPYAEADRQRHDLEADLRAGQAAAQGCRAAGASVATLVPGDGDYRPAPPGRAPRERSTERPLRHWAIPPQPRWLLSRSPRCWSLRNGAAGIVLMLKEQSHAKR